ncbi:MAG: ATP-binding protein [Lachnospiraceae bacterium]|nr:ATP-binding protein [Lachnospiraceae bacterium]
MRTEELILYRHFKHGEIIRNMTDLALDPKSERDRGLYFEVLHGLIELAGSHGYEGNLWHTYLTYLLANNENAYSVACEIRGKVEGSINRIALHDFAIFKELFDYDIVALDAPFAENGMALISNYVNENTENRLFNKRIRDRICTLSVQLKNTATVEEFSDCVTQFYKEYGVGKFGLHKAFRVEHLTREETKIVDGNNADPSEVYIRPITNIPHVYLDDLIGYESAKKQLIENTEAFIAGRKANNCLLFGDAGTGKSSSIKGILNVYYDKGLRIIEMYKHQFRDLNDVIAQIKNRNYKFIIYMDDLSFEDFEIEYKYLKAVIEGGLERKPDNVLIYATSNRRHLIREKFSDKADRDDELHTNDTVQEKLSLASRFGVTIFFRSPDKKEFEHIVTELAKRNGVSMPEEELLYKANQWELYHGGLSGRTAAQFIDYLCGVTQAAD